MPSALLLNLSDTPDPAWQAGLDAAGIEVLAWCSERTLVQQAAALAPAHIICLAPGLPPALVVALAAWSGAPPCPVALLAPEPTADSATRAVGMGIHHWQVLPSEGSVPDVNLAASLAVALAWAHARWQRESALRAGLTRAQGDLDERKWVERAKGVLMSARGMGEDEAFRLLRGAAMNVNLRLGEIARAVIEAAQWADAMNRAGQLRMLSQRLVRLAAQRLLAIDARQAATLQAQSAQRVQDNLDALAAVCASTPAAAAHAEAARQWQGLSAALAPRLDLPALWQADACASALLDAAERLTEALQAASGRRALHIVNLCGRQRMRVQRIAKHSLLALLAMSTTAPLPAALAQAGRDAALDEFEQAQRELEQAPLSSTEIRATLALVRDEWLRLLGGLRTAEGAAGRRALVHASEGLLGRLDELTAAYEHSLQVIMG